MHRHAQKVMPAVRKLFKSRLKLMCCCFFKGLCRLLIEAMHVYSLMHATHTRTPNMYVQHAHIHVIGVNMLERYLHIPACVCVCWVNP